MTTSVTASFNSKENHTTAWIELAYPESSEPTQLIADLETIGFTRDLGQLPPLDGTIELRLAKKGTDLFGGWTSQEETENLAAARQVLAAHGITDVEHYELGLADLL